MAEEEAPVSTVEATEVDTPAVAAGDEDKPKVGTETSPLATEVHDRIARFCALLHARPPAVPSNDLFRMLLL